MPPPPRAPGSGGTPGPGAGSGAAGVVGVHCSGGACEDPPMEGAEAQEPLTRSGGPRGLQTQDWVCEPPKSGHRSRRWSIDVEERRRLVLGSPSPNRGILQTVAWLLSDGVDKDVLLPWTPRLAKAPPPPLGPRLGSWKLARASGSPHF